MPTFAHQSTLPRLPIPPLNETVDRYLKSIAPVLSPAELTASKAAAAEFVKPGGLGEELQQRLIAHDKTQPNSWIENWWLTLAYHSWRESLLINSNWYMIARDHPDTPAALITEGSSARKNGQFTEWQVKRAAGLVSAALDYKQMIETQTLPVERTKNGYICMDQYTRMFGVTRVPKAGCDYNVGAGVIPAEGKHIIVIARDQIFTVDVYDSKTGDRISIADIERQLQAVVDAVSTTADVQPPVGLFTGVHRDTWAEVHKHLEDISPVNKASFHTIETSLFAMSLDDYCLPLEWDNLAKNAFYSMNGHNRWYDKALSFFVMNDGRSGVNGEHSPCDALVPALAYEYILNRYVHPPSRLELVESANPTLSPPAKLKWTIDSKTDQSFVEAQKFVDKTIADSDSSILQFKGYGAGFMKKIAKTSPDAYMQMAIQLTYYRIHGTVAPVYETASTRQYLHGRTETCRSLSSEARTFVETMQSGASPAEKYKALQEAATAHVKYLTVASNGHGVDRHLLGLRLVMKAGESAQIFKDPAYAKSSNWLLSTSGLFPSVNIMGTGFGAVVPDGYGMNYQIREDMIKIGLESKVSCPSTSTLVFRDTLQSSLRDMAAVCSAVNPAKL
ncbi:acyltransferase ChoActase/COT/CPT [Blyttiomyces helicus]|uniref:Acyltransferase ChoActase/COT/CPT n=1 Tax=Blyttiomyces helicus TaxID=388810 RepID=A0A4P9W5L0_9FUNG|nr:acyltransferase ChoActase/COT/CPT [Blyttiomyces helicus]|eukprot:RKO86040.1 acyltransferase ChoActase/COT/CPT [Blyttiomyces helicus]